MAAHPFSSNRTPAARERWLVVLTEYADVTTYTGGIGTHYAALLPAIAAQGIVVDLVLVGDERVIPPPQRAGVNISAIDPRSRLPEPLRLIRRALAVRAHLRRAARSGTPYDRVLMPEWGGTGALLPRRAPLVTNLATGIALGDWIAGRSWRAYPRRRWAARGLQQLLETRQIRRSRGVIPISRAVGDWNRAHVRGLPPATIVPNCVDVDALAAAASTRTADGEADARPDIGLGSRFATNRSEPPQIVFVGRLEHRKGIEPALDAFARVLAEQPDARLSLAGASGDARFEPSRAALLARLPERHRHQVELLGHLDCDRLATVVSRADVVICPSLWEGFGNVALEVKAMGSPLVVTTGSGFDDFCRDGQDCLMVPPGDADALATAILRIIRSPGLAESLVRGGRASVRSFTPSVVAERMVAAVRTLGA